MRENDIGDEKSSLESSQCLEFRNGTQRQNAFRNRFTWLCYEPPSLIILRIVSILFAPSTISNLVQNIVVLLSGSYFIWDVVPGRVLMMSIIEISTFLMLAIVNFRDLFRDYFPVKRILSKELDQLSKKIIADAPGADTKDWERVASHFNSYVYEKKLWSTKFFIYNGVECYETFRAHILEPFILAEDDPEKLRALEKSIPTGKKALEVYFKEIDKCWSALTSEKSSGALDLENTKLPKDTCYNKFTWSLRLYFQNLKSILLLPLPFLLMLFITGKKTLYTRIANVVGSQTFNAYVFYEGFRNRVSYMRPENKIQFLSVIIKAQDSFSGDAWDTVAKQMNIYLFE